MEYVFFENTDFLIYYDGSNEKWYVKNKTNMTSYDLSNKENMSSILRVFIEDPEMIFESAKSKITDLGVFNKMWSLFPLKNAITFCINNKMFYWLELALKWLPYIEIDDELRTLINDSLNDKHFPQKIRHNMVRYLK